MTRLTADGYMHHALTLLLSLSYFSIVFHSVTVKACPEFILAKLTLQHTAATIGLAVARYTLITAYILYSVRHLELVLGCARLL